MCNYDLTKCCYPYRKKGVIQPRFQTRPLAYNKAKKIKHINKITQYKHKSLNMIELDTMCQRVNQGIDKHASFHLILVGAPRKGMPTRGPSSMVR